MSETTESADDSNLVAFGKLVSTNSATISPPPVSTMWQYKIQYLARENSQVNEGDVVIRFDPQPLMERLLSKQSELDTAIKEKEQKQLQQEQEQQDLTLALAEAKMNFEKEKRKAEIVDEGRSGIEKRKQIKSYEIAKLSFEQAQQKMTNNEKLQAVDEVVTKSNISRLTIEVDQIKADIEKLNVKASKSGIVMYVANHEGEKVAVGDNLWFGQKVMTIPSLEQLAIQAEFDEPDSAKVAIKNKVKITLDAYPEIPFSGEISSLGQAYKAKSKQNPKIIFDVHISIDDIDSSIMRPGMKAKIELLSQSENKGGAHG